MSDYSDDVRFWQNLDTTWIREFARTINTANYTFSNSTMTGRWSSAQNTSNSPREASETDDWEDL